MIKIWLEANILLARKMRSESGWKMRARAEFQIYNRWGEKVFESSVAKPRWDGTYMGEPQPAGVYSYFGILTLRSGKTVARKGTLTLIR